MMGAGGFSNPMGGFGGGMASTGGGFDPNAMAMMYQNMMKGGMGEWCTS
jgi:RNA-binding protein Musashi